MSIEKLRGAAVVRASLVAALGVGSLAGCNMEQPENVYSDFGTVVFEELENAYADGKYEPGEINWERFKIVKKNTDVWPGGAQGTVSGIIRDMEGAMVGPGGHTTAKTDGAAKCFEAALLDDIRSTDLNANLTATMYTLPLGPAPAAVAGVVGDDIYRNVRDQWVPAAFKAGELEEAKLREEAAGGGFGKGATGWKAEEGSAYADWGTMCRSDRVHIPVDLVGVAVDSPNKSWEDSKVYQLCGSKEDNPCDGNGLINIIHTPYIPYTIELAEPPAQPEQTVAAYQAPVGVWDRRVLQLPVSGGETPGKTVDVTLSLSNA